MMEENGRIVSGQGACFIVSNNVKMHIIIIIIVFIVVCINNDYRM